MSSEHTSRMLSGHIYVLDKEWSSAIAALLIDQMQHHVRVLCAFLEMRHCNTASHSCKHSCFLPSGSSSTANWLLEAAAAILADPQDNSAFAFFVHRVL